MFAICYESCYYDNEEDLYQYLQTETCVTATSTFKNNVIRIMADHCISCHNDVDPQGSITLEGYSNVKKYVDDGSLYGSIIHDAAYSKMPTSGVKIPACDIDELRVWIEAGALDN